eukprot:749483-Hanusia_phi.AAC.6
MLTLELPYGAANYDQQLQLHYLYRLSQVVLPLLLLPLVPLLSSLPLPPLAPHPPLLSPSVFPAPPLHFHLLYAYLAPLRNKKILHSLAR